MSDMTAVAEFALVHLVPEPAGTIPLHELDARWQAWTAEHGIQPAPLVDVVRQLAAQGVIRLAAPPVGLFLVLGATLRAGV
jgi:hypothetical protein